jgi:uncharacterized protein (TIGR02231 family)
MAWAEGEVQGKSKIEAVTVFLRGAQVTRSGEASLQKGKNTVYFRGLGEGINPMSIQVSAPGSLILHSVVHEINYLDLTAESPRVQKMQDSIEIINRLTEENNIEHSLYEKEKALILKNQSLASKENGLSVEELQKASDFYRSRLTEIYEKQLKITRGNAKLAVRKQAINLQLNELNAKRNRPSHDIKVVIEASQAQATNLSFSYLVSDMAGWVPSYNLRAKDTNSPISLEYRADVWQNTGIDWQNVDLTLSSGNPNLGGSKPTVSPWYLYVQLSTPAPSSYNEVTVASKKKSAAAPSRDEAYTEDAEEEGWGGAAEETDSYSWDAGETVTLADYTTVTEGATTAEFKIALKQSIPSTGKPEQVTVQISDLPAFYQHFAVPKLDLDAFLTAGVTGWEGLNLLPGNARIFLEGTYVTEAYHDPAYTADTLKLSLGRDKKVVIERNQLKDFNKVKTIGFNRERTFAYEIKVRNTKEGPVDIIIEDQIPISQDKDIEVKQIELSGAKLDEATGKLTWNLKLAKAETQTIKLIFSVKYPKNKYVPGL